MSRRGNNEGSITKRADGRWMARYTVQTATGAKQRAVYARTRKEAGEKLTKAMADRDGGLVFEGADQILSAFLDIWLNGSVKGSVKHSTYESYGRKLDAGLAPGTVRLIHAVLSRVLDQAVRWGTVARNVCKAATPPRPSSEEIKPLDAECARRLLDAASGDRFEALYVLAVTAGLRIGELLGLKWEDLDADAGVLRVQRTKSQAKSGPRFTAPKNGKGRSIRLTRRAAEALKAHKAAQNAERLGLGDLWEDHGLIFCTHGGRPLDFHNLRTTSFKPLLERADLPHMRFHDLRHTCATLLLSCGHHPKLVQELLGHSSVAMTLDRYSHVLPGMGDQTAAAMEAALS